ncbi:MAG: hypothetical protein ABJA79_07270 [Parafilimonas sp.]
MELKLRNVAANAHSYEAGDIAAGRLQFNYAMLLPTHKNYEKQHYGKRRE